MGPTYGVVWRLGEAQAARGRLELAGSMLRLIGTDKRGLVTEEIHYEDLESVRVGRRPEERIGGRQSLVLERAGREAVCFTSITEPGAISELINRISALQRSNATHRAAVVLPLFQGADDEARRLLADGPPFDLAALGLESHSVYLTADEAVFTFEWRGEAPFESLLAQPEVWDVASPWTGVAAGPPRIAGPAYIWARREAATLDESLLPPGLHASRR